MDPGCVPGRGNVTGDEVIHATFPYRVRGYDPSQVTAMLHHIADLLDSGLPPDPGSGAARYGFSRVIRGYDPAAVDRFIAAVERGGLADASVLAAGDGASAAKVRQPVPAKLLRANAARQRYLLGSDSEFCEQYRRDCEAGWAAFSSLPGSRLRLTRSQICADGTGVLMTRRRRRWSQVSTDGEFRLTLMSEAVIDVRTGEQILRWSDHNDQSMATQWAVKRRNEPWLWFYVQGTAAADAIMTAIDYSATEILWFRNDGDKETEVVVSPDQTITPEILCVIALAGPKF